jgi:drug/metabolite transporter (DMT)-like permease
MAETTVVAATADGSRVRHPARGYSYIVLGVTLFAVNGTVSKVLLTTGISAPRLTELRCAGAVLGLGLLVLAVEPARLRVQRDELPLLASYGVLGVAFTQCFYFIAIERMPVSIALLFEYTAPVLVALYARFVLHERVRSRVWVALALAVSGLALVAEVWSGATLDGIGVGAALIAAVALAAYYILGERSSGTRDPLSTTFWAFVFASVFWAIAQPWWGFPTASVQGSTSLLGNLDAQSLPVWGLAAWMVVLGTVVPFLLILSALHHLPATRVGLASMLEPVLAGLVAWAWLGEALSPPQLAGGVVVLFGIVLAQTAR